MRLTRPALELLGAGITGRTLAEDLGVTPSAVSFQLAGKAASTSPELIEAVAERGGRTLADRVAVLIDTERELRVSL